MYHISGRSLFWTLLLIGSITAAGLSYYLFGRAIPLVHISLTMNRTQALEKADALSRTILPDSNATHKAAYFSTNSTLQFFVELEGGGKEVFKNIIENNLYQPYQWVVRQFAPENPEETYIYFTPSGTLFGFERIYSENHAGAALSTEQARVLMYDTVTHLNTVDLSVYKEIEYAQNTVASGRVDHSFTFERQDIKLGAASYRILIRVSGDVVSKIYPFIHIPEGFIQRYEHMRSANEMLSLIATLILYILYLFGFCMIGLFVFYRRRTLLIMPALYWSAAIASFELFSYFNQFSFAWFSYNTSHSPTLFIVWYILNGFTSWAGSFTLLAVSALAAENFTRLAFPTHLQFWKIYSTTTRSSREVIGRTLGGYLLVPFMILITLMFYSVTFWMLGWWSPLQTIIDPNVLATYVPWITPFARSLFAGFWEECIFRAVPLSIAALLGNRFGNKRWWIIAALIIQALVFGAAHADYATQPAYARIVELIIPSLIFGIVYLYYGLLPVIITHSVYDLVLMSLPLFITHASGMWINQACIILIALVPLIFCMMYVLKNKGLTSLSTLSYNQAATPPLSVTHSAPEDTKVSQIHLQSFRILCVLVPLCSAMAIAVGIWWQKPDVRALTITKQEALVIGQTYLKEKGIELGPEWTTFSTALTSLHSVSDGIQKHLFIWRTENNAVYQKLLRSYLCAPYYCVRYIRFTGDLEERKEEYEVAIEGDGTVSRYVHVLPENRPGKTLTQDEAETLARAFIQSHYHLSPANSLLKIRGESIQHPSRRDWTFIFEDTNNIYEQSKTYRADEGRARISVDIAGDTINDNYAFIKVPEQWLRAKEYADEGYALIDFIKTVYIYLLIIIGIAVSLYALLKGFITISHILLFALGIGTLLIFNLINAFPYLSYSFTSSTSFMHQLFFLYASFTPLFLLRLVYNACIVSFACYYPQRTYVTRTVQNFCISFLTGTVLGLGTLLLEFLIRPSAPRWPSFTAVSSYMPYVGIITSAAISALGIISSVFVMEAVVSMIRNNLRGAARTLALIICLVSYSLCIYNPSFDTVSVMHIILNSAFFCGIIGCSYYVFWWADRSLIPPLVGGMIIVHLLYEAASCAYPAAFVGNSSAALCILVFSFILFKKINARHIFSKQ